jgi:hypothetical protein
MAKVKSGGGITSNKKVSVGVRGGAAREGVNPRWTAQQGQSQGNHATDGRVLGRAIEPMRAPAPASSTLGNTKAQDVGKGGPGAGRTVHATGSQGQHGPATASVAKPSLPKDVHGFVGPERSGR